MTDGAVEARLTELEAQLSQAIGDYILLTHQLAAAAGKADAALAEVARAHGRLDDLGTGELGVDADLRTRFYRFVGKLREPKDTSEASGHVHSFTVFEGEL